MAADGADRMCDGTGIAAPMRTQALRGSSRMCPAGLGPVNRRANRDGCRRLANDTGFWPLPEFRGWTSTPAKGRAGQAQGQGRPPAARAVRSAGAVKGRPSRQWNPPLEPDSVSWRGVLHLMQQDAGLTRVLSSYSQRHRMPLGGLRRRERGMMRRKRQAASQCDSCPRIPWDFASCYRHANHDPVPNGTGLGTRKAARIIDIT
jgi:hypothetical protein